MNGWFFGFPSNVYFQRHSLDLIFMRIVIEYDHNYITSMSLIIGMICSSFIIHSIFVPKYTSIAGFSAHHIQHLTYTTEFRTTLA